ncbi:hypothetical protein A9Q74_07580 [Colwellia sp. 39_35_sub15_T18]|nr:hypothetical protein A9Q74_07580 [Colwellia sp. 39_35_sub15_T18]
MSAQANTRANQNMSNESIHIDVDAVESTTTAISVTARIDYIQRFSKQLTVVVDKNPAVYSQLARQYLAHISQESSKQEVNVAFVAASSKLNDIQMRCRLIEQLFANTLFDPEQSLAVSILRLVKQNNDTITILIEHAQTLSLQVKYELCQLVDVAKKTQNNINVVIFGLEQAAQEVAQNRTLFDKKTSIIDASNGQVLALDHARFKNKTTAFKSDTWLKLSLAALVAMLIAFTSWFFLAEYENFSLTDLPVKPPIAETPKIVPQETPALITPSKTARSKFASTADINLALLGQNSSKQLLLATAERDDILQALVLAEPRINNTNVAVNIDEPAATSTSIPALTNINITPKLVKPNEVKLDEPNQLPLLPLLPVILTEQYYLNAEEGYVVQITGFTNLSRLATFIKKNKDLEYFSYQKNLNSQQFIVLTTKIYSDKAQAIVAMNGLPEVIKSLGSFLKSVATIKREINIVNQ